MSADSTAPDSLIARLDAVEPRLTSLAAASATGSRADAPATADESQWEPGQVWGHVAEMLPHWLEEARRVVDLGTDTLLTIGRTEADPDRLAGIERWRTVPPTETMRHVSQALNDLRAFIRDADERTWSLRVSSRSAGEVDLREWVDLFMVGHLEEHASQLEALARRQ
jgi:hypothetical protein